MVPSAFLEQSGRHGAHAADVDQLRILDGDRMIYDGEALPTVEAAIEGRCRLAPAQGETVEETAARTTGELHRAEAAIAEGDADALVSALEKLQRTMRNPGVHGGASGEGVRRPGAGRDNA